MSDNVIELDMVTSLPIPADRVLRNAPENMREVVVIGIDEAGEFYFAANQPDGPSVNWLLDKAKHRLQCLTED